MVAGGRYQLVSVLGAGVHGTVHTALDLDTGANLALKILRRELRLGAGLFDRQQEIRFEPRVGHPGLVETVAAGVLETEAFYLASRRVGGVDLRALLEVGALEPRPALEVARGVLAILQHTHAAGVVHLDLKPANVMVISNPGPASVAVLDVDLAHLLGGGLRATPAYLAPEQRVSAKPGPRTDLYAVGVILFEMLAGVTPFPPEADPLGETPSLAEATRGVSWCTTALDFLLWRALQPEPRDRHRDAAEMIRAIDAIASRL